MEDKVTLARIGAYATRLAHRVCDTALSGQEAVEGPALLSLTPVRQLNLLVLHALMHRWKMETERLRSPFFNYEAPEVQQALTALMGTLSRHIRVRRPELEALVTEAATDALGLAFDPATTYAQRFVADDAPGAAFTADALRTELKYVEVNKPMLDDFISSLPPTPLDRATVLHRLKLYATAHFRELAAPDELLRQLSEIEPVTLAELREPAGARPATPPVVVAPIAAPAPVAAPKPVAFVAAPPVEAGAPAKSIETPAPVNPAAESGPASAPVVEAPKPTPPPAPVTELPKPAPVRAPLVGAEAAAPHPEKLYEKLRHDHEKVTLNDQLRSKVGQAPGLAEVLETKAKIESVGKAITTNQKYAFIAELFDGNRATYDAAVQQLDALPDAERAHAYVTGELAGAHDWAGTDEHVQKLLRLIDRKFA